jgi:fibronectin type 3 domain-containing protein
MIGSVNAATLTYQDNTIIDGANFVYAVAAVDNETTPNEGTRSADLAVKTVPSVPTGLTSTASDGKIHLSWSTVKDGGVPKKNENLAGYNIYRSETDGSGYAKVGNAAANATQYDDTTVVNGTTYYYVITAYDNSL